MSALEGMVSALQIRDAVSHLFFALLERVDFVSGCSLACSLALMAFACFTLLAAIWSWSLKNCCLMRGDCLSTSWQLSCLVMGLAACRHTCSVLHAAMLSAH